MLQKESNALFGVSESGFIQPAFSITITYDDSNNRSVNWGNSLDLTSI